jgi:hypothetical protein
MDTEILLVLPAHADLTSSSSEEQHQTKLLTVTSTNLTKFVADSNADSSVVPLLTSHGNSILRTVLSMA